MGLLPSLREVLLLHEGQNMPFPDRASNIPCKVWPDGATQQMQFLPGSADHRPALGNMQWREWDRGEKPCYNDSTKPCVNSVQPQRLAAVTLQTRSSLADSLGKNWEKSCLFIFPTGERSFHHCWSLSAFQHPSINEQDIWTAPALPGDPPATPDTRRDLHFSLTPRHLPQPKETDFTTEQDRQHGQHNSCKAAQQWGRQTWGSSAKPANRSWRLGRVRCPQAARSISNPFPAQSSTLCHLTASLENEGLKGEHKGCLSDA